ncbi:toxin [Cytobacillus suaedae]|nr:toxin [Cytobacillus suaedae]
MRKFIFLTAVFLFLFFVPGVKKDSASTNGVILKDFSSITFFINQKQIDNYHLLEHIVVLPEDSFNQTEAINMIQRINLIHPSLLQQLISENITIKLFNGNLTDEPSAAHLRGITPRGYSSERTTWDEVPGVGGGKTVLAKIGHSENGDGHGSLNLELHELAHSIDRHVLNLIREDTIFKKIWKEEASQVFPNREYFITYPEEYFAETFVMYYFSENTRNELKEKAPMTYELFRHIEQSSYDVNVSTYR